MYQENNILENICFFLEFYSAEPQFYVFFPEKAMSDKKRFSSSQRQKRRSEKPDISSQNTFVDTKKNQIFLETTEIGYREKT